MRLLLAKAGDAAEQVRARHGDYEDFFGAIVSAPSVEVHVVDVARDEPLLDHDSVDALLVTGSASSVTEWTPWMKRLAEWSRRAEARGLPQLGVCFGHQLMARAFGGEVHENPNGFELGTYAIEFTPAARDDPVLGPVVAEAHTVFQQIHGDEVHTLPPGAVLLAGNATSRVQAFSRSGSAWAVQFHPEISKEVMQTYVEARGPLVEASAVRRGLDPDAALQAAKNSVRESPGGPELLRRFVQHAMKLTGLHPAHPPQP